MLGFDTPEHQPSGMPSWFMPFPKAFNSKGSKGTLTTSILLVQIGSAKPTSTASSSRTQLVKQKHSHYHGMKILIIINQLEFLINTFMMIIKVNYSHSSVHIRIILLFSYLRCLPKPEDKLFEKSVDWTHVHKLCDI